MILSKNGWEHFLSFQALNQIFGIFPEPFQRTNGPILFIVRGDRRCIKMKSLRAKLSCHHKSIVIEFLIAPKITCIAIIISLLFLISVNMISRTSQRTQKCAAASGCSSRDVLTDAVVIMRSLISSPANAQELTFSTEAQPSLIWYRLTVRY